MSHQNPFSPAPSLARALALAALLLFGFSHVSAATVVFQVHMGNLIQRGDFIPGTDFVDLAGTFNGWGSSLSVLSDPEQDSLYSIAVSGFSLNQAIEFKFRINGLWDGTEEFPGNGNNRVHTVSAQTDSLFFWYNDEPPYFGQAFADFTVPSTDLQSGTAVSFQNLSGGDIDFYQWRFTGGVPATSTQKNPTVFYPVPGTFDVELIVGNASQQDTLHKLSYLNVNPRDRNQIAWWNDRVFYEIFVRSFFDSDGDGIGDFQGLIQKLDYLNDGDSTTTDDLGIGGIWLMPINPSPSYHGYDVTDYRAINPDFGTLQDFRDFLDAAHQRGIKVIMDFVMNHSSSQHPWFIDSRNSLNGRRDFYRWSASNPGYNGPWGQQVWHSGPGGYYYGLFWGGMPDLNYAEAQVKDSLFAAASFWLDEVGVDGFRLDAVKYIFENGNQLEDLPATLQFWQDFEAHTDSTRPLSLNVGEAWSSTDKVVPYVEDDGLDFCFEFDLAGATLNAVNNENAAALYSKMDQVYGSYPHLQWGSFLTNHDMDRVFNTLGQDLDRNKVAAAIYLTLPGVPFLYYGEEIGMTGQKPDEYIRTPMQWDASPKAGFTTGQPWIGINGNSSSYNVASQQSQSNSLWRRYQKLIQVRNALPALRTGDYRPLPCNRAGVFSFLRTTSTDTVLVVVNLSGQAAGNLRIGLPGGAFTQGGFNWWEMMGNQAESHVVGAQDSLEIAWLSPYGVKIFSDVQVLTREMEVAVEEWRVDIWPVPASDFLKVRLDAPDSGKFSLAVLDLHGREILRQGGLQSDQVHVLEVGEWAQGVYLVVVEAGGRRLVRRVVR